MASAGDFLTCLRAFIHRDWPVKHSLQCLSSIRDSIRHCFLASHPTKTPLNPEALLRHRSLHTLHSRMRRTKRAHLLVRQQVRLTLQLLADRLRHHQ